jgi:hypothetical protein
MRDQDGCEVPRPKGLGKAVLRGDGREKLIQPLNAGFTPTHSSRVVDNSEIIQYFFGPFRTPSEPVPRRF